MNSQGNSDSWEPIQKPEYKELEKLLLITPAGRFDLQGRGIPASRIGGGNYLPVRKAGVALLIRIMPGQPR